MLTDPVVLLLTFHSLCSHPAAQMSFLKAIINQLLCSSNMFNLSVHTTVEVVSLLGLLGSTHLSQLIHYCGNTGNTAPLSKMLKFNLFNLLLSGQR